MNTFGQLLRLTTFGESHGPAIGGVLDGMPSGLKIDFDAVRAMMARRRPNSSAASTSRREADEPEFLSGIFNGVTTGTPIAFVIRNTDMRSADYSAISQAFRPCHADYTYEVKYGPHRDYRGGGRASARETAVRVVAGALAMQALRSYGVEVSAHVGSIGPLGTDRKNEWAGFIEQVRSAGDTVGGTVECEITGLPAGVGEPLFGKLQACLAAAMMSIPAAKGFEYGIGFEGSTMLGSEVMDRFNPDFTTATNHSGGIQGGISNGMPVTMRVAFKPVATLMRELPTVDREGRPVTIPPRGRHDVCVVPRAVPVVEAMAALVALDAILLNRSTRL